MLTQNEILKFLKKNKRTFQKKFHISKVGIFGSFARNEQKANSDIDILIEREPNTKNIFDLDWNLQQLLKKRFGREIDICNEKYIKSYCRQYVLKDAIYV